jgi:hypothetical protein
MLSANAVFLSGKLVFGLLFALELVTPAAVPMEVDVFRDSGFERSLEIRAVSDAEEPGAFEVVRLRGSGDAPQSLLRVEPSSSVDHIYTVLPQPFASEADRGSGETAGTGAGSGTGSGPARDQPLREPAVFDLSTAFTGSEPNLAEGSWQLVERGDLTFLSDPSSGILLVVHASLP